MWCLYIVVALSLIVVEQSYVVAKPMQKNEEYRYMSADDITEPEDDKYLNDDNIQQIKKLKPQKIEIKGEDNANVDIGDTDSDFSGIFETNEPSYDDPYRGKRLRNNQNSRDNLWKINLNRTKAGQNFFQSDIHLDLIQNLKLTVQENFGEEKRSRGRRAVRKTSNGYLWKRNIVFFKIDNVFSRDTKHEIKRGIRHWKKSMKGCLKFMRLKNKTTEKEYSKKYFDGGPVQHILFTKTDAGCWSQVGRTDTKLDKREHVEGQQLISIGEGCGERGTVIHEIGHAIGFWHEQSRRDRDEYVKIIRNNIIPGQRTQFKRMALNQVDSMNYAYDYWSIMHYGQYFFSKNDRPTIKVVKKYRMLNPTLGQREGLSYLDIAQVRAMYKCNKLPSIESSRTCVRRSTRGRDYRGTLDYTESGVMCQPWNKKYPHKHDYDIQNKDDNLVRNYCRNPKGEKERPWCFTTLANKDNNPSWEYCDIKVCRS